MFLLTGPACHPEDRAAETQLRVIAVCLPRLRVRQRRDRCLGRGHPDRPVPGNSITRAGHLTSVPRTSTCGAGQPGNADLQIAVAPARLALRQRFWRAVEPGNGAAGAVMIVPSERSPTRPPCGS